MLRTSLSFIPLLFFTSLALAQQERIITLSPALTELFFQLGKGSSLVGVSQFSDFPETARTLPQTGGLFFPSLERVLRLNPTWVLNDFFTENGQFLGGLSSLGVRYRTLRIDSVKSLVAESEKILKAIYGEPTSPSLEEAKKCLAAWEAQQKNFRFLFLTWGTPPIAASSTTFFSNLFEIKGGGNLVSKTIRSPYIQLSEEWIIQQRPDVIFYFEDDPEATKEMQLRATQWWGNAKVKLIGLKSGQFARTSLSPIFALKDLEPRL